MTFTSETGKMTKDMASESVTMVKASSTRVSGFTAFSRATVKSHGLIILIIKASSLIKRDMV